MFNAPLVAATNVDTITGFEANALDRIALDPAVFGAVAANGTSALDSGEFRSSAGGDAADADDFILYDNTTGNLYDDADDSGAGAKVLFATLVGPVGTLDYTDFMTGLWLWG